MSVRGFKNAKSPSVTSCETNHQTEHKRVDGFGIRAKTEPWVESECMEVGGFCNV